MKLKETSLKIYPVTSSKIQRTTFVEQKGQRMLFYVGNKADIVQPTNEMQMGAKKPKRLHHTNREHISHVHVAALSNMAKSTHSLAGLFWLGLLLISSSVCTWFIIGTFQQYASNQVTTTYRYLTDVQAVFPTVLGI